MNLKDINHWRERDLHPPSGYTPVFELLGRKRRLEQARKLAETGGIEISANPTEAVTQLFNIYYDWLASSAEDEPEI